MSFIECSYACNPLASFRMGTGHRKELGMIYVFQGGEEQRMKRLSLDSSIITYAYSGRPPFEPQRIELGSFWIAQLVEHVVLERAWKQGHPSHGPCACVSHLVFISIFGISFAVGQ